MQTYTYYSSGNGYRPLEHRTKKKRRYWLVPLIILLAGGAVFTYYQLVGPGHNSAVKQQAGVVSKKIVSADISGQINKVIAGNPNVQIGMAIIDLSNNHLTTYGSTAAAIGASTTKMITAVDFLGQVESGRYSLAMPLGPQTAGWQLQQMIQESNNDSWQAFYDLLGTSQVQSFASNIGLSSFNANTNTITPADEALLLQKLYDGQLIDASDTKLLYSYMQNTNDQTLIPAAVPKAAVVYQKYGELVDSEDNNEGNWLNDAAIILYKGQSIVLTIYTNQNGYLDINTRTSIIHQLTQIVVSSM